MKETMTFGKYFDTPIEWLILKQEGNRRLLLSRYVLDAKRFFSDCIYIGWEKSNIREWLHHDFMNTAFTPDEQARILETSIHTPPCQGYEHYGASDTIDKIFLLSTEELLEYLPEPESRFAQAEPQAIEMSADLRDFCPFTIMSIFVGGGCVTAGMSLAVNLLCGLTAQLPQNTIMSIMKGESVRRSG